MTLHKQDLEKTPVKKLSHDVTTSVDSQPWLCFKLIECLTQQHTANQKSVGRNSTLEGHHRHGADITCAIIRGSLLQL